MEKITFTAKSGESVHYHSDGQQFRPESLFGMLCSGRGYAPLRSQGPALIRTGQGHFEAGDFNVLNVTPVNNHLSVTWQVGESGLHLRSEWDLHPQTAVLSRQDTLINPSPNPVTVYRWLSRLALQPGDYQLYCQNARWGNENQGAWMPLHAGAVVLGCEGGRTTQGSTPYACLRDLHGDRGLAFHLLPRGNWMMRFTLRAQGVVIETGNADDDLQFALAPGESWSGPEVLIQPLENGQPQDAAARLHQYANLRWYAHLPPELPVIYNTWLDQYDNLEPERLRAQLAAAKEIGCEIFVIDAGWFGRGQGDWFDMTGHWYESTEGAFQGKMAAFADEVRRAGLGFGLWMEAEHTGPKAPIRQQHPEWFVGARANGPRLDLENPAVYAYLRGEIRRLIETYQLAWIKIDFNIELGIDERGSELFHYYDAFYRLLDELEEAYPDTIFEGCSSGAARLDLEVLRHFPLHFLSDTTNTIDILRIAEGARLRLPPGRLGLWNVLRSIGRLIPEYPHAVAEAPESISVQATVGFQPLNLIETLDLDFATLVTLPGAFGYSGDPASLSQPARRRLAQHTTFYKQWRRFIAGSCAHPLTPPRLLVDRQGWSALQLYHPHQPGSLVFAYRIQDARSRQCFRLHDLEPHTPYRVSFYPDGDQEYIIHGAALMNDGLEVELPREGNARIYIITPVEQTV